MTSLQNQLRRQSLITLLALLLPLLWLADYGVRQLTTHTILSRLQHDADSIVAALSRSHDGHWQVDGNRLGTVYNRVYSGHYFALSDNAGTDIRSRSLWDKDIPLTSLRPGSETYWKQTGIDTGDVVEQWLSFARGLRIDNSDLTLWVAEDIAPLKAELNRYRLIALALLLMGIITLALVQRRQLSRAFARLHPLQQQLRELRFGERDHLSSADKRYPAEVQPLAEEIDRLLDLLQQRVSRSRNAIGNLAHEMKHPLQRLQLLSEQLSAEQQRQQQEILLQLQHLVQRELKRARIAGVSSPGRQTRAGSDIPPLLEVIRQLYPQARVTAEFDPAAILPQDRDDMLEILGNLLDNACKYAPGSILLTLSCQSDSWTISVCDQGPGIEPSLRQLLLERGRRLDEQQGSGTGLGLAIVSDIVDSYGGRLELKDNVPHGLCVVIRLPRQASEQVTQHSDTD